MQQLQKIEIDWDIHKLIETERNGFEEPPYVALRRLLKLPTQGTAQTGTEVKAVGRPWVEDGVEVPHGSMARMEYLRGTQIYEGKFLNGKLVVNGKEYDTLSAASISLAVTKKGTKPSLNGWIYWRAKFPGELDWKSLNLLREQVQAASGT